MDWALLGTAIAILGSSIFSGIASKRAQRRQNAYNDQAADKAMEQQQSLIDAQNQYNSPANQMSLLSDAGLNPLLAYNSLGSSAQQSSGEPHVASHDYIKSTEDTIQAVNTIASVLMQAEQLRSIHLKNEQQEYRLETENPIRLDISQAQWRLLNEKYDLTEEQLARLRDTHNYFVDTAHEQNLWWYNHRGVESYRHMNASYDWDMDGQMYRNWLLKNQWETADYAFSLKKQFDADERAANLARKQLMEKFYSGTSTWKDVLHFLTGELLGNVAPTIFGAPLRFNMPTFNNNSEHFSTYQQNNNSTQTHQHVHQHTGSTSNTTNYAGDNNTRNSFNNKYKGKNTWNTNRK